LSPCVMSGGARVRRGHWGIPWPLHCPRHSLPCRRLALPPVPVGSRVDRHSLRIAASAHAAPHPAAACHSSATSHSLALFGVEHLHTAPAPITSHRPSPALRANAKLMPSRCPLQMHQVQMSLFLPRVRTRSTHLLSCSESDPAANRWSRCHEALRGNARPDDSTCYPMAVPRLLEVWHARTQTLVGAFV
jgi:hypothetical protein